MQLYQNVMFNGSQIHEMHLYYIKKTSRRIPKN